VAEELRQSFLPGAEGQGGRAQTGTRGSDMLTARASRRVVLFQPSYAGKLFGPPLGLLSLAASLRQAGYDAVIIDGALDRDYRRTIAREVRDSLCFGISLLTGPMIREAIDVSRMVRELAPELPIIFGGWHPSL